MCGADGSLDVCLTVSCFADGMLMNRSTTSTPKPLKMHKPMFSFWRVCGLA